MIAKDPAWWKNKGGGHGRCRLFAGIDAFGHLFALGGAGSMPLEGRSPCARKSPRHWQVVGNEPRQTARRRPRSKRRAVVRV